MKNELELLLIKLERLELELVEEGVISDEGHYSDKIGEIKEDIYDLIREASEDEIVCGACGGDASNCDGC